MQKSYSSKIDSYSNEKVRVVEIRQRKSNRITLITDIVSNTSNLKIIYKYYKPKRAKYDKDIWLIYDVEIMGVSILKSDKAQFREYLKSKTIKELMNEIAHN